MSKKEIASSINRLNQNLADVKKQLSAITSLLEEEQKQQTLERALKLTDLNSVTYKVSWDRLDSSDLAEEAIKLFSLDEGLCLPDGSLDVWSDVDDHKKSFRDAFVDQVKTLIKREPRLEWDSNEDCYVIYYK